MKLVVDEETQMIGATGTRKAEPTGNARLGKVLIDGAAEGFGSVNKLAQATGIPRGALASIRSGRFGTAHATRMLLAILASQPGLAQSLCEGASFWMASAGIGNELSSRRGAVARARPDQRIDK